MQNPGARAFAAALNPQQWANLAALRAQACAMRPPHWVHWRCGDMPLGCIAPERAVWLAQQLASTTLCANGLVWHASDWTQAQRSESLQAVLQLARDQRLLTGWREERFSFWSADSALPDPLRPALFEVERSGFRFLGLLSHAVHVNGFLPDGRLWCARRSLRKATDPGMLDNVTAGGLPSGESVQDCLRRELAEEAGLFRLQDHGCEAAGRVRTSRQEAEGLHDEYLHVFNLTLAADFEPVNQDGEVSEFMCLEPTALLEKIHAGCFTSDAVQTLIQGLGA
jgi:8-oxo-dGTP pyrophosphatase MutT (NUDIX family)